MSPSRDAEPAQLVISLIEQEVLPRLQSGDEAHLVVAHRQPQIVRLPALPGVSSPGVSSPGASPPGTPSRDAPRGDTPHGDVSRGASSPAPRVSRPGGVRDRWHKDALAGFAYVIRGEADLLLSRRVVTCHAGNFAFFLPHTWRNFGSVSHWERSGPARADCDLLWLYLTPQEVLSHACWSRGAEHIGSRHLFIPDHRLLILAELLQEELSLDEISRSATQLLWLIYERVRRQLQQGNFLTNRMTAQELPNADDSAENIGRRAQQYVDTNLAERLTLESVARALFTSRARLAREFPRHTGETFGVYLLRRRLERAQHLLATTSYSIRDVAWRAGFPDADYFSAAFRREVGSTPTEFRKERR